MRTIEIDGKSYNIKFTTHAGAEMERRENKRIDQLIDTSLTSVELALWGGLKTNHPSITVEQAGALVDAYGDRTALMTILLEEMRDAGFFGLAAKEPPNPKR